MRRRAFVATAVGTLGAVAGCSDAPSDDPDDNEYGEGDEPEMVPTLSMFPDGWRRLPERSEIDAPDAEFAGPDDRRFVVFEVFVRDSPNEAWEAVKGDRNGAEAVDEWTGPKEYDLADQAIWYETETDAHTVFRDSNAIGSSVAREFVDGDPTPARDLSQTIADRTYQRWQQL